MLSLFLAFNLVAIDRISVVDHKIAAWFHGHLTRPFIDVMLALSEVGSPLWIGGFTSIVILIVILKKRWNGLLAIVLTVPGGMLVHHLIQIIVHRHRPFRHSEFLDLGGYSFPSGHTLIATVFYVALAWLILSRSNEWRWRFVAVAIPLLMVPLVGFSRAYLGAHYLSDVLGAIAEGAAWLTFCLIGAEVIKARGKSRPE